MIPAIVAGTAMGIFMLTWGLLIQPWMKERQRQRWWAERMKDDPRQ